MGGRKEGYTGMEGVASVVLCTWMRVYTHDTSIVSM
jgi:hypothetical protein